MPKSLPFAPPLNFVLESQLKVDESSCTTASSGAFPQNLFIHQKRALVALCFVFSHKTCKKGRLTQGNRSRLNHVFTSICCLFEFWPYLTSCTFKRWNQEIHQHSHQTHTHIRYTSDATCNLLGLHGLHSKDIRHISSLLQSQIRLLRTQMICCTLF